MNNQPFINLITSHPIGIINDRFLVKISVFDNGKDKSSIMIAVVDLIGNEFKLRFFNNKDQAESFLNLLKSV